MDRIPNELPAEIREVFPLSDLIFQVLFYRVFERAATFITQRTNSGFDSDVLMGWAFFPDWQQVVFGCERHARTCQHPGYGVARLSENGAYLGLYCSCSLIYLMRAATNMQKILPGLCGKMRCAAAVNAVQPGDMVSSTPSSYRLQVYCRRWNCTLYRLSMTPGPRSCINDITRYYGRP